MRASALAPFYDGNFDDFENEDSEHPKSISELLTSYAMNFGGPFFDLNKPRSLMFPTTSYAVG
ncbi:MAG: hypothetical protein PUF51_07645 [Bifidobacteriaceae bacterium]|nr:hypothetical protein [Bifidobacteriaceae bacterium]